MVGVAEGMRVGGWLLKGGGTYLFLKPGGEFFIYFFT